VSRVVIVTQQADRSHPFLAATVAQIRALAERVDEVVVLADAVAAEDLPPNCRVRSFAASRRSLRGVRFVLALAAELRRPRDLVVLAHMCPIYAVLAAPLARPLGVPVLLWFTQQRAGRLLVLADRLVDAIVTVDARSVPLRSVKVRPIGHGIDPDEFPCAEHESGSGLQLLSLGRYAAAKRHDVAVRGVRELVDRGFDARLLVHGSEATPHDADVRSALAALARELGVEERVTLGGSVRRDLLPGVLAEADVLVNASESGSADKVVFEAALSGLLACAASPVFDTLLPEKLRFPPGDAQVLAERLATVAGLPDERRRALAHELRARVLAQHSVGHWADAILEAAAR
jgi:glycosyltransferase involved in cell wall biosynthesis